MGIVNELKSRNKMILNEISDFHFYHIPKQAALIEDGGHDMYDNGNMVRHKNGFFNF